MVGMVSGRWSSNQTVTLAIRDSSGNDVLSRWSYLLLIPRPYRGELSTWQRSHEIRNLHHELELQAIRICAMAISNENPVLRVNAFRPIAFCESLDSDCW